MNPKNSACQELMVLSSSSSTDPRLVTLLLEDPGWTCSPGQFVMLRPVHWGAELLWPRPFSICDLSSEGLRIFFQVVGRGTARLAKLQAGQKVVVWGPLGRGFSLDFKRSNLILAGGMGIAPFVLLAKQNKQASLSMLFGHNLPLAGYPYQEIAALIPSQVRQQCSEADLLCFQDELATAIEALAGVGQVLACGPEPMLKVVQKYCLDYGTAGQISLENRMACGVGACLGCVAKSTKGHYLQSCVHGPVFDVSQINLGVEHGSIR